MMVLSCIIFNEKYRTIQKDRYNVWGAKRFPRPARLVKRNPKSMLQYTVPYLWDIWTFWAPWPLHFSLGSSKFFLHLPGEKDAPWFPQSNFIFNSKCSCTTSWQMSPSKIKHFKSSKGHLSWQRKKATIVAAEPRPLLVLQSQGPELRWLMRQRVVGRFSRRRKNDWFPLRSLLFQRCPGHQKKIYKSPMSPE